MTKKDMRKALDRLIERHEETGRELRQLRDEMHNRPPIMRGETVSDPVTQAVEDRVIWLHENFPDMPQHEIGRQCNIQQSRVSEILAGIRT